ncbi:hypothetical protein EV126DRAFT_517304 [Verticillium dahliae]|uniref:Uncharacterized protein n=1 Tax=Verticillium dahliae TaxID=27337 RepID=A0AA44W9H6_VERDA|nr:hypothetical protein EV126DRAFT_517304 [Verticillium dahliae]PNH27358.1 hypothetical protein BJF96_g9334 [Verticillium dahliae]PNH56298.1 hypothetical protein VD0003_g1362 [Verticillium dahliae]
MPRTPAARANSPSDSSPTRQGTVMRDVYHFIKKEGVNPYPYGDVYGGQSEWREKWMNLEPNPDPYHTHVRDISSADHQWPHLRLLADFMNIGTVTARWQENPAEDDARSRAGRTMRTNVCLLEYYRDQKPPQCTRYKTRESLKTGLAGLKPDQNLTLRLFVVEDLSRTVIEALGYKFGVEPDFFREHLYAYAWNNPRDPWRDATNLEVDLEQRRWLQIRFPRARYFQKHTTYSIDARGEEMKFNVERRADDDENRGCKWDDPDALTSFMRSKASLWTKKRVSSGEPETAILLLDPTIQNGLPLWKGYKNWEKPPYPLRSDPLPEGPKQTSFFDDFVYWAQKPDCFPQLPSEECPSHIHIPVAALLHLLASEWLLIIDYVKARLNIIDWELAYPQHFVKNPDDIDGRMRKLHAWRRFIPVFREMLSDMLLHVFHSSSHIETMRGGDFDTRAWLAHQTNNDGRVHDLVTDVVLQPYKRDFALVLGAMEEFQKRLERLTQLAVQTSIVDDSRRSMADNRNLHRLTWLATLFLPLSFIAALLSMQSKVSELGHTLRMWAVIAAPSAGLTLFVVLLISSTTAKKAMSDFPWFGNWKPFVKKDSSRKRR